MQPSPAQRLHTITPTQIIRLPTTVSASRQDRVHRPCLQFNRCSSHLEQFATHR